MSEDRKHLVTIDVQGIQEYLYRAGTLRDATGGSYMVHSATTELVEATLRDCGQAQGGIWYAGGGNARILFDREDAALRFVRAYSARLTRDMPLLRAAVYCGEFRMGSAAAELKRHAQEIESAKERPEGVPRFLRLGFESVCKFTGAPVIGKIAVGEGEEVLSASCLARARCADAAHDAAQEAFWRKNGQIDWERLKIRADEFRFPRQLADMGSEEGQSHMAVVHIDGNSMGNAFATLQEHTGASDLHLVRELSEGVRGMGEEAVRFLLRCVAEEMRPVKGGWRIGKIRLAQDRNKVFCLPLRPILLGGDDLTLVCDGRLGLCLTTAYLNKFTELSRSFLEKHPEISKGINGRSRFTCSAGVAIVNTHYPFRSAYAIAEALLRSAKRIGRPQVAGDYNAIDFHVAAPGARLEISKVRDSSYSFGDCRLTFKPYFVGEKQNRSPHPDMETYWRHFDALPGLLPRNKWKDLAAALHQGPQETKKIVEYLEASYRAPGDSRKTADDFKKWARELSGDGELENSLFESVGEERWSYLLDLLECDTVLARRADFEAEFGLRQDIFWRETCARS